MRNFKDVVLLSSLTGAIACLGLTGCAMQQGKKARETGRTVTQYQTDKATSDRVADALKAAPVYKFPDVQVQTFDGNVQLSGFVHTQDQKQQAEQIARQVPGVNRVMDGLAIVPENPTPTGRERGYPQVEEGHRAPEQTGLPGQPIPSQQQPQAPAQQTGPANTPPPATPPPNDGPGSQ